MYPAKVGDFVIVNLENDKIKRDKKDVGWTYAYQAFLNGKVFQIKSLVEEEDMEILFKLYNPDYGDFLTPREEFLLHYDEEEEELEEQEHTGGSVNYYKVEVKTPTTFDKPYRAECNDLIEALDMNYAEGNAFKAIWRRCAERQGKKKKGNNTYYDAEKLAFFAQRILEQEKEKQ